MTIANSKNSRNEKKQAAQSAEMRGGDKAANGSASSPPTLTYAHRYVHNPRYEEEVAAGYSRYARIGHMYGVLGALRMVVLAPLRELFGLTKSMLERGVHNTALLAFDQQLLALVESSLPHRMQLTADGDLRAAGDTDFGGRWRYPFSAHAKVDANTNELILFGYDIRGAPPARFGLLAAGQPPSAMRTFDVNLPKPLMMHDCAFSAGFLVVLDLPLVFDPEGMVRNNAFAFQSQNSHPARIGLVPRSRVGSADAQVQWFPASEEGVGIYVFHTLTAYDEGDETVLVAAAYDHTFSLDFSRDPAHNFSLPYMYEWRMNRRSGAMVRRQVLDSSTPVEFPVVPPALLGRKPRFAYAATIELGVAPARPKFDGIVKYELRDRNGGLELVEVARQRHGHHVYGGEMVFVPAQGGQAEDDGYLVGYVHNEEDNRSMFSVIDARTMQQAALVDLPSRVPYGFHGLWVPEGAVDVVDS